MHSNSDSIKKIEIMMKQQEESNKRMEIMNQTILDNSNKIINSMDNRDKEIDSLS